MTKEELIRNLKYTMEKHKNDKVDTFGTNISLMCKDVLDYLEQQENKGIVALIKPSTKTTLRQLMQPSDDCVSRQAVINEIKSMSNANPSYWNHCDVVDREDLIDGITALPPVTPTNGTCKDCKHWKDSDGVYRRGIGAESKCPINIKEVYEGTFYCKEFKKRGSEND